MGRRRFWAVEALPGPDRGAALPMALVKAGLRLVGGADLADAITDLTGLGRRKFRQLVAEANGLYDQPGELRHLSNDDRQAAEMLITDLFPPWPGDAPLAATLEASRLSIIAQSVNPRRLIS